MNIGVPTSPPVSAASTGAQRHQALLPFCTEFVSDLALFYGHCKSIKLYLQNDNPEKGESPKGRKKLEGLYECILCACCSTSCLLYWWNQDEYLGPATLMQTYRWKIADPRIAYRAQRKKVLQNEITMYI